MYYQLPETNVRVLGSMHMVPAGAEPLPAWARAAYDWCDDLVIESDPPSILQSALTQAHGLQAQIQPRAWEALQRVWPTAGPLSPLERVKPWAAFLFFGAFAMRDFVVPGIEPLLIQQAAFDGRSVGYLETAAGLAALFESLPPQKISRAFEVALDCLGQMPAQMAAMHAAWVQQDREAFYAVASRLPLFAFPEIRGVVLEQRNRSWVPAIEQLRVSPRKTLVVVGALHLCGPGNLEECLEARFTAVGS